MIDAIHVRELRVLVDYRTDLVKRRTMAINQLKAQLHLWLDHTPATWPASNMWPR